jgi:SAM-dependent methyltransferase
LYETSLTRLDRAFLSALGTAYRVLDIGAGNGRFSLAAADAHWMVALEISSEAIIAMRALAGSRRMPAVCQASALHLPFSAESFHVAVSQDLVEHLHPDHLLSHLAEICRILVPGGRYLLHTPSSLYGSTSLGLHLREYRLREVRLMAETAGFRARWICLNTARIGWVGALPMWILPIVETWEALWRVVGDLGLRRYAGRWYASCIPDVDLDLFKPERRCVSCT